MTWLVVFGIVAAALFGAPLFSIFGIAALVCFFNAGIDTQAIIIAMSRLVSAPILVAIPLFTFAGYMMAESKTPQRMVRLAEACIGWMPGGMAIVALLACAFFTAFTGASGVTIIALGGLLYPVLLKQGFQQKFSLGLVTTCGSLGLLFPPSLPLILYGLVASVDVDKLFIAGLFPGFLLMALLGIYSARQKIQSSRKYVFQWKELVQAVRASIWEIPLPILILVGIYGGYTTAAESAAVAAFYVLIVEVFIYRDLKITTDVPRVMKESMVLVGGILIILAVALGFTDFLIDEQIPMKIFEWIRQYISSKWTFLILLNGFLLIVGMLMDIFSAIIVVVPLILPIAKSFGVDPFHLGIIFLTNLEIGYLTPPVGLNLYLSSYRFKEPIMKIVKDVVPFILLLLIGLLLITYVPSLSLWLVRVFS
ncbi:MAG: TRAP transporter large permease subunit [Deltaproteobacteria bacterium]|nr:TRAP transporter large permease subunit [Deltaproteobacteria bacterium]